MHDTVPPEHAPASSDNLLLDIGGGTGALIILTSAGRDQAEVEISPAGQEQARTHNVVRARATAGGSVHAAVFPSLAAGDYVVWRDESAPAGTVTVHGGQVASFRLD
ncbi:MAG TPA: hypothetical protein VH478_23415 [Trebonia sp.]|jgi:hypothetical protein|nr:hypothetical protein [Trebonia sp.]